MVATGAENLLGCTSKSDYHGNNCWKCLLLLLWLFVCFILWKKKRKNRAQDKPKCLDESWVLLSFFIEKSFLNVVEKWKTLHCWNIHSNYFGFLYIKFLYPKWDSVCQYTNHIHWYMGTCQNLSVTNLKYWEDISCIHLELQCATR